MRNGFEFIYGDGENSSVLWVRKELQLVCRNTEADSGETGYVSIQYMQCT